MFLKVFGFELRYQFRSRLFLFGAAIFLLLTFLAVFSPNVQLGGTGGAKRQLAVCADPGALHHGHTGGPDRRRIYQQCRLARLRRSHGGNHILDADYQGRLRTGPVLRRLRRCLRRLPRHVGGLRTRLDDADAGSRTGRSLCSRSLRVCRNCRRAAGDCSPTSASSTRSRSGLATSESPTRDCRAAGPVPGASGMLGELDYRTMAALVDPSGGSAIGEAMQYWTVFERNTQVVPPGRAPPLQPAAVVWYQRGPARPDDLALCLFAQSSGRRKKKDADEVEVAD